MKSLKIAVLLAKLVLSFHGEGHPPHEEHRNDRVMRAAVCR